jgi:hypothetical protein
MFTRTETISKLTLLHKVRTGDRSVREMLHVCGPIPYEELGRKQILDVGCYRYLDSFGLFALAVLCFR